MTPAATVHHVVEGPPGAPVLVLSNALGSTLAMWDPQVPELARHFRVIRYDMRGHGRSPVPRGPYAIEDLGRDLLGLLDRLGAHTAHLCGLSIGGMVSAWVAANAPQRVERLVLCCTSAHFDPPHAGLYADRAAVVRAQGTGAIADAVVARWLTPPFAESHPTVVDSLRAMVATTPAQGYAGCCDALAAMDLLPDLPRIRAATLVISAAGDEALPPSHGERIAAAIAGSRFVIVEGAAHLANIERPEEVNDLIRSHLLARDAPLARPAGGRRSS